MEYAHDLEGQVVDDVGIKYHRRCGHDSGTYEREYVSGPDGCESALAPEQSDRGGYCKRCQQCCLHRNADYGVGICRLFDCCINGPGNCTENRYERERAVLHRGDEHSDEGHADSDILQQMPALTEEHESDDEDDHWVHVISERRVQHVSVHDCPVEQAPVGADKHRCRDEIFHELFVPEGREQLAQTPGAYEVQPGKDHTHDYPHAEDEHGVETTEQVPVNRLQAPDQVTEKQGEQGFFCAGQVHCASLSKDTDEP